MRLEQANINHARDLQNLADEEQDHRVKKWLLERSSEQAKSAAGILELPLEDVSVGVQRIHNHDGA